MPIAPPVPIMSSNFSASTRLGARVLTKAGGELLWSHGDGPAAHALGHAFVDEHIEVAANRHLAHVELVGELRDPDAAVRVEAVPHQLESFERLDVHRATSWSSASVARAVSASAKAPNVIPCTSAFPIAVASTGPVETGSGVRRCNASRYSADRDPPPNTRMPRTSWPSLEGSEWTTLAVVPAMDSMAVWTMVARLAVSSSPAAFA